MLIGIPLETAPGETRVTVTPETAKKLKAQGHTIRVQSGAGVAASATDAAYVTAGAEFTDRAGLEPLAAAGITAFALEAAPRTKRAQSMDVLSSQANIAGYKAVMKAADEYQRLFPMLMAAAGGGASAPNT